MRRLGAVLAGAVTLAFGLLWWAEKAFDRIFGKELR